MTDEEKDIPDKGESQLEGGTYEIIRNRLQKHGENLKDRLAQLNVARKEVFGSIETTLLATERVTTEHNCTPRDMVPLGENLFLFGYNVTLGLKTEASISDVFGVFSYDNQSHVFHQESLELLNNEKFREDFHNLYTYYRLTKFVKFAEIGPHLFMVFQIGKSSSDIKTFKWTIKGNELVYLDNRSDHEFTFPEQHDFTWQRTTRDMHRPGLHGHISIKDRVFVETIGGDLTIKVEDNTESGFGIYAEPVDHEDQTLDDAEIYFAEVGHLIFLKMRPYQESNYRYIIFNEKIQEAIRVDALEDSCMLLPDDQGVIFAKGYYIQTGEFKLFDNQLENMLFERRIASPNGEDYMYIFYNADSGMYSVLSYNIIEQQVKTPILCHGFAHFKDGELLFFKEEGEPRKHHVIQIWQTPYTDPDLEVEVVNDSYLYKVGNKDIVRAMAECGDVIKLINKEDSYANLYVDIVKLTTDIIDSYYWIGKEEANAPAEPLQAIKSAAASAVDEFDKVVRIKKNTREEVARTTAEADELISEVKRRRPDHIDVFVQFLARLREGRGTVISLKDLRYVDNELVESYETTLQELTDKLSKDCVSFLLRPDALKPYEEKVGGIKEKVEALTKVIEANRLEEEIVKVSKELEMLIEIVSNLKIEDATQTTRIIDNISSIYANFNQINAALKRRRKELLGVEGKAEFNSQLKLVNQGVVNYLDVADTPERCDEFLTKLMVQLEELEGKFSEFDEFITMVSEKREEIYNAFESKKIALVEARNKRANALLSSAERILKGVGNRLSGMKTVAEINGYFASDLMVDKVRDAIQKLTDLGDSVKADDVQSRLKTAREDALRQLKDKAELFVGGDNMIKFGRHQFLVNTQPLDLTIVMRNSVMCYHLTGTNFFEAVEDEQFLACKPVWDQALLSENNDVYRAEYLAWKFLEAARDRKQTEVPRPSELTKLTHEELMNAVRTFMAPRYNEGYAKGVHDEDTATILSALLQLQGVADLLRYPSASRACAALWWQHFADNETKQSYNHRLKGAGVILSVFPDTTEFDHLIDDLLASITSFNEATGLFAQETLLDAAEYLFHELSRGDDFVVSKEAGELYEKFHAQLKHHKAVKRFEQSLATLKSDGESAYRLVLKWLHAFCEDSGLVAQDVQEEAAVLLLNGALDRTKVIAASMSVELDGLHGNHALCEGGKYALHYNRYVTKLRRFENEVAPMFERYGEVKKSLVATFREDLRLEEFKPRVLSSFVRNKLLDEVYLPLIGDNLAKQIGSAGEDKRTDLMGMLLLISPPGYGKTTLMEYLASRLGIVFMKINGPAIGHDVTSLDPAAAPNSGAREELEKLNLSLEMGDNVMLYLDDIQHCHPEFLQKFISLCDAQRKIEGVYKGRPRTYDLRGRKVCVVMAGNPYTESGDKFKIPDMLANRADIYNLGDIIGDSAHAFKLSYLENSLTSNPVLARLANKSHKDALAFIKMAEGGGRDGIEFEANHGAEEVEEYVSLFQKLTAVRDLLLRINQEYIYSAAQADAYRTEPPFKLQGSYRNMNKLCEKVMPVMNASELQTLLVSHYEQEAQTLTTGAEANLLKFKELFGVLDAEAKERWESIKLEFQRQQKLKGLGGNQMGRVLEQMESLNESLKGISGAIKGGESTPSE